jgi:hypothetical protein
VTVATGPALGSVVAEALGLRWQVHADPYSLGLDALAGLAVRRNLKRAQLIVSTVLAKHVPARPSAVRAAGLLLAGQVHEALTGESRALSGTLMRLESSAQVDSLAVGSLPGAPAVIGFCETATSLGHCVADAFTDAVYLHTTRRPDPQLPTLLGFDEEHSHAVAHHLQPGEAIRDQASVVVLVDDELSTGTTALNTIEALEALRPGRSYVIAALLDLRPTQSRQVFAERVAELGVSVSVASLLDGELLLPDDVLERAMAFEAGLPSEPHARGRVSVPGPQAISWPTGVAYGGRHGFTAEDRPALSAAIDAVAGQLPLSGGRVLVLGTEELMYAPVRLAHALELLGHDVLVQSTTRSPVIPLDLDGYAIRRRLVFPSLDDPRRESYLYNVSPPGEDVHYSDVVLVVEDEIASAAGLLDALGPFADTAHVVAVA